MLKRIVRRVLPASAWTWMRLARLRRSVSTFRHRVVRHTYGGIELDVLLADPLGAGWYDTDWPELPEVRLLRRHQLRPGARVFDLGAHQAVVALMLANVVGPEGMVVAVEANAHNARVAGRNKDLNRADNLRVVHAAAAQRSGQLVLNQGLNGQVDDGTGEWGRVTVTAFSVDDLAREYGTPQVLFIDVEGYECHVLRGAGSTLAHRLDCFVEVHVGHGLERLGGSVEEVLSFFPESAYDRFVSSEASPEPVSLGSGSMMTRDRFFLTALSR